MIFCAVFTLSLVPSKNQEKICEVVETSIFDVRPFFCEHSNPQALLVAKVVKAEIGRSDLKPAFRYWLSNLSFHRR